MKTLIWNFFITISLIIQLISCKQHPQDIVSEYYRKGEFNGSVLIMKNGQIVCDTALGFRNIEKGLKADKNTSFYIASLSKPFTAAAILMLEQKGLLKLDDKASRFIILPEYAKNITIRQLLHHTSGIRDYENLFSKKQLTNQEVINWLFSSKNLDFAPDSKFKYSNSGYIILSCIIEKVSGKSYSMFINEHIITPLKMHHTYVYEAGTVIQNRASGYNKEKKPDDYSILTTGDGGIYSTPEDLYKFDQALRNYTLINKENTQAMYSTFPLSDGKISDYGFAWFIENNNGKISAMHTGGLNGFKALFWRDLQHNTCIIALTNQGEAFPLGNFLHDIKKAIQ
ncbi:serine hydrolase domain-containing protein [Chryseobacterium culicis]|uniref:Serine hydrolase n=1 Tax=Chryseobacterium culicis TaxID=680127 RepID=A0A2S9CYS6_CHRCI|nr:serine hydrolase domain-containing protein [Chryseobacterium culicis]PRB85659.1 serine hydrolase [Chryseobacterium culicis]PRB90617.1 serine hydrolase [Chryseobacterium culicis]